MGTQGYTEGHGRVRPAREYPGYVGDGGYKGMGWTGTVLNLNARNRSNESDQIIRVRLCRSCGAH